MCCLTASTISFTTCGHDEDIDDGVRHGHIDSVHLHDLLLHEMRHGSTHIHCARFSAVTTKKSFLEYLRCSTEVTPDILVLRQFDLTLLMRDVPPQTPCQGSDQVPLRYLSTRNHPVVHDCKSTQISSSKNSGHPLVLDGCRDGTRNVNSSG